MEIQWHGLSCVSIRGKNGTVLIDPYDSKQAGISMPKIPADVILLNPENPLFAYDAKEDQHLFDWPGEYEARGILIDAIPAYDRPRNKEEPKKDTAEPVLMFAVNIDDFRIAVLSNLGHKLTPEHLEKLGNIDILILPVGGTSDGFPCLNAEKAQEVVEQVEPRMVIPMLFDAGQKAKLSGPAAFLKEVGATALTAEKSVKLTGPSQLPIDKTDFMLLEAVTA